MRIELDLDLASRLHAVARRLKRAPEECARSAILAFIVDCEENARMQAQLAGGTHVRPETLPE